MLELLTDGQEPAAQTPLLHLTGPPAAKTSPSARGKRTRGTGPRRFTIAGPECQEPAESRAAPGQQGLVIVACQRSAIRRTRPAPRTRGNTVVGKDQKCTAWPDRGIRRRGGNSAATAHRETVDSDRRGKPRRSARSRCGFVRRSPKRITIDRRCRTPEAFFDGTDCWRRPKPRPSTSAWRARVGGMSGR
jgi:hypothetical protein